jgi:hypothetical protein
MPGQPFTFRNLLLVRPAAALVPFSPYVLSNTAAGDIPTATIAGVGAQPDIFIGAGPTQGSGTGVNYDPGDFYNSTPGKRPEDAFATGDIFTVILGGYPIATLRAAAAITEGVSVIPAANGQIAAASVGDERVFGKTIGATTAVNGLVDVLINRPGPGVFTPVTFASLPTAASAGSGARRFISDSPASPVFGAAAAGGGSLVLPVYSNGTAWLNG